MIILRHVLNVLWLLGAVMVAASLLGALVLGIWGKRHEEERQ